MSELLKAWAHWASLNPIDEDQKEHADDTLKLFKENEDLKYALEWINIHCSAESDPLAWPFVHGFLKVLKVKDDK